MSGILKKTRSNETYLLDGHNNPGFSGGPVVFHVPGKQKLEYKVIGVISAYRQQEGDVYYDGKATGLKHVENAGIIIAPSIKRVIDIINENPIGHLLS